MDTKEYILQNLKPNLRPKTIEECWATIDKLIAIIQKLEERLNINSKNSSQPPSMDFGKKKKDKNNNNKKSSGRKPGGSLYQNMKLQSIKFYKHIVKIAKKHMLALLLKK